MQNSVHLYTLKASTCPSDSPTCSKPETASHPSAMKAVTRAQRLKVRGSQRRRTLTYPPASINAQGIAVVTRSRVDHSKQRPVRKMTSTAMAVSGNLIHNFERAASHATVIA